MPGTDATGARNKGAARRDGGGRKEYPPDPPPHQRKYFLTPSFYANVLPESHRGQDTAHDRQPRDRDQRPRRRRDEADHLLHVRLPLRDQRASQDRPRRQTGGPLHRGQSQPPGQQGRALRQGQRRDHAALFPGPAARTDETRGPARLRPVRGDFLGRGAGDRHRLARQGAQDRSQETRLLHRPRPEPEPDRLLGDEIRHPEFRRSRRFLLGQYGRRRAVHLWRGVLGIRRSGLGSDQVFHALRRRRGPCLEPDQDRHRQAQETRRQGGLGQPGAHRLQRRGRRMGRHPPRHRRAVCRRADPRAVPHPADRPRLPGALHQRPLAGDQRPRRGR